MIRIERRQASPADEPATLTIAPFIVLKLLVALSTLLIALDILLQTCGDIFTPTFEGWDFIVELLDADREASIPTWWNAMLLVTAALIAALVAHSARRHQPAHRIHFSTISVIFLVLSIDEVAMAHERTIITLRDKLSTGGALYFAWVIPGTLAVLLLTLVYARFVFQQPKPVRGLIILSAVVYLAGALGMEMVGGWWVDNHGQYNLGYMTITSVEEWLEFLGVSLFIYTLLRLLASWRSVARIAIIPDP